MKQRVDEGLRTGDLENLVYPVFEIDTYRSKMGEDRDVCVLAFQVHDRHPASDLMEFVEKGYNFVLDADISSGENEHGDYFVFVEIQRSDQLPEHILDILYGARKLTGIRQFKFKYHKRSAIVDATEENLKQQVPLSGREYDRAMQREKLEGFRQFFDRTLMDDISLNGDVLTIHKAFGQQIHLRVVQEQTQTSTVFETLNTPIALDDQAAAEVFWLTKVLGDYNINKVGDNFVFDNNGQAMVLQRL